MKFLKIIVVLFICLFNQACTNESDKALTVIGSELLWRESSSKVVTPIASNQPIKTFLVRFIDGDNVDLLNLKISTINLKEQYNAWHLYYLVIESIKPISLTTTENEIKINKIEVKINEEIQELTFGNLTFNHYEGERTNDIIFYDTPVSLVKNQPFVYSIEFKENIRIKNIKFSNKLSINKINGQKHETFINKDYNKNEKIVLQLEDNRYEEMSQQSLINTDLIIEYTTTEGQEKYVLSSTFTTLFDSSLLEFKNYLNQY